MTDQLDDLKFPRGADTLLFALHWTLVNEARRLLSGWIANIGVSIRQRSMQLRIARVDFESITNAGDCHTIVDGFPLLGIRPHFVLRRCCSG